MNKFLIALLIVLFVPGLAILFAVMIRVLFKGTKPSSRETPSAKEEEPPGPTVT